GISGDGRAYVYDLSSSSPGSPIATLRSPNSPSDEFFGICVSILGSRVLVSAPLATINNIKSGVVYVFDMGGPSRETPIFTIYAPSPNANANFGSTMAADDSRVVIGAPLDDTGAIHTGSAYVYDFNSAAPATPVLSLHNPAPAASDLFGVGVAISG